MATTNNKTSRRSVLGALAILPAIAALPAAAQGMDPTRFNRRLATYRRRLAQHDAFYAANVIPLDNAHEAIMRRVGNNQHPEAAASYQRVIDAEAEFGRYVDRTCDALDLMLRTPAPDQRALATRIDTMLTEGMFESGGSNCHEAARALLADARRLGGEA